MKSSLVGRALTVVLGLIGSAAPAFADTVDFNRDVLPILTAHCFACHGPDANQRQADLRLDLRDGALAVIVPGQPAKSELLTRITADDSDGRMPPPKQGPRLKPDQIRTLRAWIE